MPTETNDSIPTRETLLSRLRDLEDQTSWREFFDTYYPLIFNVVRKAGFSEAAAQDIVQETFVTMSRQWQNGHRHDPKIGSFKTWLVQITRSRIIDALRRQHSKQGDQYVRREEPLGTSLLESVCDEGVLDAIWDAEWHAHLLDTALEHVKQHAEAHQFQIFSLHVVKGVSALQVARRLGVKLPEVYFAKYKISARVKKEIKRLESNPP